MGVGSAATASSTVLSPVGTFASLKNVARIACERRGVGRWRPISVGFHLTAHAFAAPILDELEHLRRAGPAHLGPSGAFTRRAAGYNHAARAPCGRAPAPKPGGSAMSAPHSTRRDFGIYSRSVRVVEEHRERDQAVTVLRIVPSLRRC